MAIEYLRWISWHEPWPLIQTKRPDFLTALKYFYGDCAVLDIGQLRWTDKEVIDKLLRSSYSDTPLVSYYMLLFNIIVDHYQRKIKSSRLLVRDTFKRTGQGKESSRIYGKFYFNGRTL